MEMKRAMCVCVSVRYGRVLPLAQACQLILKRWSCGKVGAQSAVLITGMIVACMADIRQCMLSTCNSDLLVAGCCAHISTCLMQRGKTTTVQGGACAYTLHLRPRIVKHASFVRMILMHVPDG
eukprot:3571079-Amphidinium_carterae.1